MSGKVKSEPDVAPGCVFFVGLVALSVGVHILAGAGWAWVAFGGAMTVLGLLFAWALVRLNAELDEPNALDEFIRNQREANKQREARERDGKGGAP